MAQQNQEFNVRIASPTQAKLQSINIERMCRYVPPLNGTHKIFHQIIEEQMFYKNLDHGNELDIGDSVTLFPCIYVHSGTLIISMETYLDKEIQLPDQFLNPPQRSRQVSVPMAQSNPSQLASSMQSQAVISRKRNLKVENGLSGSIEITLSTNDYIDSARLRSIADGYKIKSIRIAKDDSIIYLLQSNVYDFIKNNQDLKEETIEAIAVQMLPQTKENRINKPFSLRYIHAFLSQWNPKLYKMNQKVMQQGQFQEKLQFLISGNLCLSRDFDDQNKACKLHQLEDITKEEISNNLKKIPKTPQNYKNDKFVIEMNSKNYIGEDFIFLNTPSSYSLKIQSDYCIVLQIPIQILREKVSDESLKSILIKSLKKNRALCPQLCSQSEYNIEQSLPLKVKDMHIKKFYPLAYKNTRGAFQQIHKKEVQYNDKKLLSKHINILHQNAKGNEIDCKSLDMEDLQRLDYIKTGFLYGKEYIQTLDLTRKLKEQTKKIQGVSRQYFHSRAHSLKQQITDEMLPQLLETQQMLKNVKDNKTIFDHNFIKDEPNDQQQVIKFDDYTSTSLIRLRQNKYKQERDAVTASKQNQSYINDSIRNEAMTPRVTLGQGFFTKETTVGPNKYFVKDMQKVQAEQDSFKASSFAFSSAQNTARTLKQTQYSQRSQINRLKTPQFSPYKNDRMDQYFNCALLESQEDGEAYDRKFVFSPKNSSRQSKIPQINLKQILGVSRKSSFPSKRIPNLSLTQSQRYKNVQIASTPQSPMPANDWVNISQKVKGVPLQSSFTIQNQKVKLVPVLKRK